MNCAADGTPFVATIRSCHRKVRYPNEREAWGCIFHLRHVGVDATGLIPYSCPHCLGWHLGNEPPRLSASAELHQLRHQG